MLEFDAEYRAAVGVDANGASISDSRDVSTYAHMFGCWETLHFIRDAMTMAAGSDNMKQAMIEAAESVSEIAESIEHPQGAKLFNGKTHQVFGHQYITRVDGDRLNAVHTTSIEDTFYPDEVDYTQQGF